jgi:hypothetical protein
MHAILPLDDPGPTPRPFTRAQALARGTTRPQLERLLEDGSVRRVLRGVYVAASAPDTRDIRAEAVGLVAPDGCFVVDRTAAWIHGVDVGPGPVPLETLGGGAGRRLTGRDVVPVQGLRVTTPLRTALDLGRVLPMGEALAVMDALMRLGGFGHRELLAELPRFTGLRGVAQLRVLSAQADPRSLNAAESVLRLRWHEARVPTPTPGLVVAARHRVVRLALALEGRRFGAVIAGSVPADDLVALEGAGWRVLSLSGPRILACDPMVLTRHLEREFHQYLVAEVEGW